MLTDVNLKVEIVKDNNKFYEYDFRNILNPSIPKISKWSENFQNVTGNDLESAYKSSICQIFKVLLIILEH